MDYVGRFAPSPTGPLHFGSLIAAVGSFLQARRTDGLWLVRIDDVDELRNVAGASDEILRCLEHHGLHWDTKVVYQTQRKDNYSVALEKLHDAKLTYPCTCSRKALVNGRYIGTCRAGIAPGVRQHSTRLRTNDAEISFIDEIQGRYRQRLWSEIGDFNVRRADGLTAYHLATVVDDAEQGVTDIVRGSDLLASTPRQIHLQRCLGLHTPNYAHLPTALNELGYKLSKQTFAAGLDDRQAGRSLWRVLQFLGQKPPAELLTAPVSELITWAISTWQFTRVPRIDGPIVEPTEISRAD